jgi:hypothetical protein
MRISYDIGVSTPAGWRSVTILAEAEPLNDKMATVVNVVAIDGEKPDYKMSRTGARRQQFNGLYFAHSQVGKRKRLSNCTVIEL